MHVAMSYVNNMVSHPEMFVPTLPSVVSTFMNESEWNIDQRVAKLLYFDLVYNTIVSGMSNTVFNEAWKHHYKPMLVWRTLLERNDKYSKMHYCTYSPIFTEGEIDKSFYW